MSTTVPMAERSYYEADARERIDGLLDAGSFTEFVGPRRRLISPHLAQLDTPGAFDDGIVVEIHRLQRADWTPHPGHRSSVLRESTHATGAEYRETG